MIVTIITNVSLGFGEAFENVNDSVKRYERP